MVFHCFFGFRIGFERKTKGKLLENQSQPTPGPLRSLLLGLSLLRLFSFTRKGEGRIRSGEFWTYSGPLLSLFLLLSLLWGSFSGTSPESLLVVWPPLGSSGWLWPPPSSLCLLLRVIRKKSDSGASPELRSGPSVFSLSRVTERGEYRMGCSGPAGTLLSLFLLLSLLWGSFSGTSPESLLVVWPPPGSSG